MIPGLRVPLMLIILGLIQPVYAVKVRPTMTPVDILNVPTLSDSVISPDGQRLVFIKGVSDWRANKVVRNLWIMSTAGDKPRQLTFDLGSKSSISWSPQGNFVSFIAKRDDNGEHSKFRGIYLLSMEGGEAGRISSHPGDIKSYQWSADGKSIYYLAGEPLEPRIEVMRKSKNDLFPFEESLSFQHIWKLDVSNGKSAQITHGEFHVLGFDLSADGRLLAYNRAAGKLRDDWHRSEIWVADSEGKKPRKLTDNNYAESKIEFSPDNKSLLFLSDVNDKGNYYYDKNLFVLSIGNGSIKLLAEKQSFEVQAAHWGRKGKSIYIQANMGVHSELWSIALNDRNPVQLTKGQHTVTRWHYDRSANKHSFVLVRPDNPGELVIVAGRGGKLNQLTDLHKDLATQFHLPVQKVIHWQAKDGTELEGLLSFPLHYKKGRRYPMVVHAHGGPASSDQYGQFRWRTYIPLLAAEGYLFFSPNYRGSRGYGDEFLRDMVGGYFNHAHLDVMSGIDHLVKTGVADKDRLVMSGWSAGGHMTNKLITFTDRFSAASSGAGAVEWMSM